MTIEISKLFVGDGYIEISLQRDLDADGVPIHSQTLVTMMVEGGGFPVELSFTEQQLSDLLGALRKAEVQRELADYTIPLPTGKTNAQYPLPHTIESFLASRLHANNVRFAIRGTDTQVRMYLKLLNPTSPTGGRKMKPTLTIDNLSIEPQGQGHFTRLLPCISWLKRSRQLTAIRMVNIKNERLVPFFRSRGYKETAPDAFEVS